MKFLKTEILYSDINGSKEEQEYYDNMWNKCLTAEYTNYLKCKHKFSKSLQRVLESERFHDAYIQKISIEERKKYKYQLALDIIIDLEWNGKKGKLYHYGVKNFSLNLKEVNDYHCIAEYLYGEFYVDDDNMQVHNFLNAPEGEVNITCKRIDFKWNKA